MSRRDYTVRQAMPEGRDVFGYGHTRLGEHEEARGTIRLTLLVIGTIIAAVVLFAAIVPTFAEAKDERERKEVK